MFMSQSLLTSVGLPDRSTADKLSVAGFNLFVIRVFPFMFPMTPIATALALFFCASALAAPTYN